MDFEKDLISVIVPVYNVSSQHPNALERLLGSLKSQTYLNSEFLIIDDGSTDDSGSICDKFAEEDSRFRIFHNENHGMCLARNFGLDNSRGEFIFFSDSDDSIHPQCLEIMHDLLAEHPECDMVIGLRSYVDIGKDEEPFEPITQPNYTIVDTDAAIRRVLHRKYGVWNRLIRRAITEKERFVNCRHEDFDYSCRMAANSRNVINLNEITYHYFQYEQSMGVTNAYMSYVNRLQTMQRVYHETIKDRFPHLRGEMLWYLYYQWIEMHKLSPLKKELEDELKRMKAGTWKDVMRSNLSFSKKCALQILTRFPDVANFAPLKYLRTHFNLFRITHYAEDRRDKP